MKTPTLIVRLVGLYLLVTCSVGLMQIKKVQAMASQFGESNMPAMSDLGVYLWLGLGAGLAATLFAGPLARILTFDSEPHESSPDFEDQLLGRK